MKVKLDMDLSFNQFKQLMEWCIAEGIEVDAHEKNIVNKTQVSHICKPQSEISKLKLFMDVFHALSGKDKKDVDEKHLLLELIATDSFTLEDAANIINKGMQNGLIYEIRSGFYARA